MDIIEAIRDPNILGDTISPAQEAALRSLYGLPVEGALVEITEQCTGSSWSPGTEYREAALICGRRSGKSDKLAANVAIYEALFRDHNLSPGEKGVVLLMAQNMRQANVVKGYIEGKIDKSPVLRRHVVANRAQELELDNGITIAIHPSSFRAIRGLSVVCAICDECAFWWTESTYANPDTEVVKAVRPSMATFDNAKLLLVSSPYTRSGVLWDAWRKRDTDKDVLVWHAPTSTMNPTVPKRFLDREKSRDPENFRREYMAEFTDAISSFLSAEAIQECVVQGRDELPPEDGCDYVATVDAAFKGDRFTLCLAHRDLERDAVIVDCLRGWQGSRQNPLSLSHNVMPEIKALGDQYHFDTVYGDQFGAEPLKEVFKHHNLTYRERTFTNTSKADFYGTLRTRIMDETVELLDHADSLRELRGLELELLPGGAMRIGHGSHGRDDYADAIALAVSEARREITKVHIAGPILIRLDGFDNYDW